MPRLIRFGESDSLIADAKDHLILGADQFETNGPAVRRIFDRVGEQVNQNVAQQLFIQRDVLKMTLGGENILVLCQYLCQSSSRLIGLGAMNSAQSQHLVFNVRN
jgi:hypothetical protein